MSLAQGFPSTFSDTQKTNEVLHNLDNETKKIYNDVNAIMAADGHSHTGNGSDGALLDFSNPATATHQPNPVSITSATGVLTLLETSNSFIANGTEAITSIAGWTKGIAYIRWNTARTLTYNATSLILQNAVDRITTIGEVGVYEFTATGVRELLCVPSATELSKGVLKLSTSALALEGTNDSTAITPLKLRNGLNATGSAPVYACRAWVNFNSVPLTGTYSQSGTIVTVTMTAHGLSVGDNVNLSVTSGTGVSGSYAVATVVSANIFTYTAGTSLTTSGNITRNIYIRGSGNVSSIIDNGVGDYTINFITNMPNINYVTITACQYDQTSNIQGTGIFAGLARFAQTVSAVRVYCNLGNATTLVDTTTVNVAVFC